MTTNETINVNENDKRSHDVAVQEDESQNEINKKVRLFSAKQFRKQLKQGNNLAALNQFLTVINESKNHDYVFDYLENGGNCLELLQTLELDSAIPPALVFNLVTHLLLKISVNYAQYRNPAYETCRYILSNYVTVINKMINLSSTSQERKSCLKLLTAIIAFSSNLAKDILLQVNFHSTNIELLTKNTGEKDSVRDYFIRFVTAFLVDGNYPALSNLLEKKGFIKSVIPGLQYDTADMVCIVMSAMKNHILENHLVSKTAKMKVFNTSVVRDIVNLYNWKGPATLKAQKKNKTGIAVDEYSKSKVSECVHDFLLVLCTSHKYGVIFKDHLVGLARKNQNGLMYTVLESLDRPWEHSYACELVTKICGACPDLAKTMWNNLKPFLEPRLTERWLNAMKFAKILLKELRPSCIEFCVQELTAYQLSQIVNFLVAPLPILKTIVPEKNTFEQLSVKEHVMALILEMLRSLEVYLTTAKTWLSPDDHVKLKNYISTYVTRNFLDANTILKDWDDKDTSPQFLECIFDIFVIYKHIAPQLLSSLAGSGVELTDLLGKVGELTTEGDLTMLQIKIIEIFIEIDQSKFLPNAKTFSISLPLLLQIYYDTKHATALSCIRKLLKNTGIFDGCFHEINIWINGILDLKKFDDTVAQNLVHVLQTTYTNPLQLIEELSNYKSESDLTDNVSEILESLLNDVITSENKVFVKHKYLSPMVLGYLKFLSETEITKNVKIYANFVLLNVFHCQTDSVVLKKFINSYDVIPKNIREYFLAWTDNKETAVMKKSKGRFEVFQSFSAEFLTGSIENFLSNCDLTLYDDLPLNLLQTGVFYTSNSVLNGFVSQNLIDNCEKLIKYLVDQELFHIDYVDTILGHPILLNNVSFISLRKEKPQSLCTNLLLNIIEHLSNSNFNIESYLKLFRERLLSTILKILKKPRKYNDLANFTNILQLFNLNYEQCCKILSVLIEVVPKLDETPNIVLEILIYSLDRFSYLCQTDSNLKPLEKTVVECLTNYFAELSKKDAININKLSVAFHNYFKIFPHNIVDVNTNLVKNLLNRTECNKENVSLAVFLLYKNTEFFDSTKDNLDNICNKKGVILPVIEVLVKNYYDEQTLEEIYLKFEPALLKALQKPQKAGQYFHQSYSGLPILIEKYMTLEKCNTLLEKVQKFEVAEIFHTKLLEAISRKLIQSDVTGKKIYNVLLTFIHLQMVVFKRKTKTEEDTLKLENIASVFNSILEDIYTKVSEADLKDVSQNETLKLYVKFCLKFGVSGQAILLTSVRNLVKILEKSMDKEDGRLILEMLLSHSEFLTNVLGEYSPVKLEILALFLTLCKNWNEFMERSHIPVLLAAYRAMVSKCDRLILTLLKMYEANAGQTSFYDFKPYLWGKTAATHYSVRLNMENVLWRQPKMGDVLEILQEETVQSTISNYPLKENLRIEEIEALEIGNVNSYDLKFLLPLFSQLLAPEQQVHTYKFTRSGALSLTVIGLSSQDKELRQAACHVLSRFYFHMEARQSGKDNLLWLRYIEAVCKGTAVLPDFKLNNFSAIYLARMALILTQPNHVMYVPLSQHLTAKSSLDFSTVPELYTFLHSPDVKYKEHRIFILELLSDGLRTEKDFTDFLRSMAFKLFSVLYSSSISDSDTRLLILDIVNAACGIPLGVKMLCENHSLLTQLYSDVYSILLLSNREKVNVGILISKVVNILSNIVNVLTDKHSNFLVLSIVVNVVKDDVFNSLSSVRRSAVFEIVNTVFTRFGGLVTDDVISVFMSKCEDKFCKYIFEYGCRFVNMDELGKDSEYFYLRLLLFKLKT